MGEKKEKETELKLEMATKDYCWFWAGLCEHVKIACFEVVFRESNLAWPIGWKTTN
jgi:hypothetical protein